MSNVDCQVRSRTAWRRGFKLATLRKPGNVAQFEDLMKYVFKSKTINVSLACVSPHFAKAVVRSEFLQFKAIAAELAQEKHSMFMSLFAVCFSQVFVFSLSFFSFFQNGLFRSIEWTCHCRWRRASASSSCGMPQFGREVRGVLWASHRWMIFFSYIFLGDETG